MVPKGGKIEIDLDKATTKMIRKTNGKIKSKVNFFISHYLGKLNLMIFSHLID
jgi:hypothetical protein